MCMDMCVDMCVDMYAGAGLSSAIAKKVEGFVVATMTGMCESV